MRSVRVMLVLSLSAVGLVAAAPTSQAALVNLVTNGGFELPEVEAGFVGMTPGGTDLPGWDVGGAGVDLLSPDWRPAAGRQSLDLSASDAGSVTQTLATTAGTSYRISWSQSMNPECGNTLLEASVLWNDTVATSISMDAPTIPWTPATVDWTPNSVLVTAVGEDTVTFRGDTATACGIMLDAVRVAPADDTGTNLPPELDGPFELVATNGTGSINVLDGATDPDGDTSLLQVVAWEQTPHGQISCAAAGTCTYTLLGEEPDAEEFDVIVEDQDGGQTVATVVVSFGCAPLTRTIANGDPGTTEGAVSVEVDALGAFGSSSTADDATFNPIGPKTSAGTTFESYLYAGNVDQMLSHGLCDHSAAIVAESLDSVISTATVGGLDLQLTQTVAPIDETGSTLTQVYAFSNNGTETVSMPLVRHVDGDLRFDGSINDGGAAKNDGRLLYEFDSGDNPNAASTFVGITGDLDSDDTPDRWTIQPFRYTDNIVAGDGIPAEHDGLVHNDTNADLLVDTSFDVVLAQQWDATIPVGGTAILTTTTRFGEQAANEPPVAADHFPTTAEGSATVDLLVGAVDPDGPEEAITYVADSAGAVVAPTAGDLDCSAAGVCTYTVTDPEATSDTFDYAIADGLGAQDTGTVTVTIPPDGVGGDDVDAEDDSKETSETQPVEIPVADNDPVPAPITGFSQGSAGSVVSCDDNSCTYTPKAGKTGEETFTYTIGDGSTTDTATVTVNVLPCADVAGAVSGQAGLVSSQTWIACHSPDAHGTSTKVTPMMPAPDGAFGLLTNGTRNLIEPDGAESSSPDTELRGANDVSILRLDLTVPPAANCLTFDMVFASDEYPEYVGEEFNDAFIAELGASTWTVGLDASITAPNNFAKDATGKIMSVNSAVFDGGGTTTETGTGWNGATGLLHAATPITPGAQQLFLSIFDQGDHILDSAAFVDRLQTSTVGEGECQAGVSVPPTPETKTVETSEDTPLDIDVASDSDADALTIEILDGPDHGLANVLEVENGLGAINYDPAENWHGQDQFDFSVNDGSSTETGTITVDVAAVDDLPVAEPIEIADGRTDVPFDIVLGISDVDDTELSFDVLDGGPLQGTATEQPIGDGDCTDSPTAGVDTGTECTVYVEYDYTGAGAPTEDDLFQYVAVDGDVTPPQMTDDEVPVELTQLVSEPADVIVGFGTVPDPPTAVGGTAGDRQVTVTWTAPVNDGGSAITGYKVTCTPAGSSQVGGSATQATITGLTNNVNHVCSVVASNEFGDSTPSSTVTLKPLDTTPPPPLNQLALQPGLRKATLSWVPPVSTDYYGLKILRKVGTTRSMSPTDGTVVFNKTKGQAGFAGPFINLNLAEGTHYTYTAFTYDNAVQGANHGVGLALWAYGTDASLTATPATAVGSTDVTLNGRLMRKATGTAAATPLAGKTVRLFGRSKVVAAAGGAFDQIGTAKTTNAEGKVTWTHDIKQNWEYKLQFGGASQDFGDESTRKTVLVQPSLKQVLSRTSLLLGGSFKLTGTITPSFAGEKVILEFKKDTASTWSKNTTWTMATSGQTLTKDYTITPPSKGKWQYRLTIPATTNVHQAFTTQPKTVTVS